MNNIEKYYDIRSKIDSVFEDVSRKVKDDFLSAVSDFPVTREVIHAAERTALLMADEAIRPLEEEEKSIKAALTVERVAAVDAIDEYDERDVIMIESYVRENVSGFWYTVDGTLERTIERIKAIAAVMGRKLESEESRSCVWYATFTGGCGIHPTMKIEVRRLSENPGCYSDISPWGEDGILWD